MPRRRPQSSSPLHLAATTPSSEPSSKPSSTPVATPPATASARGSTLRSPKSKPATKEIPRRQLRARLAAVDRRRKSGLTIEQRLAALCDRLLQMVKHYPLDGIELVEVCEELVDTAEFKLSHLSSLLIAIGWFGLA
jgi:hypothetical protein